MESVGKNLRRMKKDKNYTFIYENWESHCMIVNTGKEEVEREPDIQVEKGKITRTKEYKYLGHWITESGTVERQLEESKANQEA